MLIVREAQCREAFLNLLCCKLHFYVVGLVTSSIRDRIYVEVKAPWWRSRLSWAQHWKALVFTTTFCFHSKFPERVLRSEFSRASFRKKSLAHFWKEAEHDKLLPLCFCQTCNVSAFGKNWNLPNQRRLCNWIIDRCHSHTVPEWHEKIYRSVGVC